MDKYDPLQPPDPETWLAIDEDARFGMVEAVHDQDGQPKKGEARLHVLLHVMVENQAARGDETPVRLKLHQLMAQGLDRHEAVHCIASVLGMHLRDVTRYPDRKTPAEFKSAFYGALKRLNARKWLRSARR